MTQLPQPSSSKPPAASYLRLSAPHFPLPATFILRALTFLPPAVSYVFVSPFSFVFYSKEWTSHLPLTSWYSTGAYARVIMMSQLNLPVTIVGKEEVTRVRHAGKLLNS